MESMLITCPYCGSDAHSTDDFEEVETPPEIGGPPRLQRVPIVICDRGHQLPPPQ